MTKTPFELELPKPLSKADREARKVFRQVDADKAMSEHEKAQRAFHKNRERLKAERLAREARGDGRRSVEDRQRGECSVTDSTSVSVATDLVAKTTAFAT
jgi:hypothetical protein